MSQVISIRPAGQRTLILLASVFLLTIIIVTRSILTVDTTRSYAQGDAAREDQSEGEGHKITANSSIQLEQDESHRASAEDEQQTTQTTTETTTKGAQSDSSTRELRDESVLKDELDLEMTTPSSADYVSDDVNKKQPPASKAETGNKDQIGGSQTDPSGTINNMNSNESQSGNNEQQLERENPADVVFQPSNEVETPTSLIETPTSLIDTPTGGAETPDEIQTADNLQEDHSLPDKAFSVNQAIQPKLIYVWDRASWLFQQFGSTQASFRENGCRVHQCRLVDAVTLPDDKRHLADAILFSIRDFFLGRPQRMSPNQIWVIRHYETPLDDHPIPFRQLRDKFNLTYTYLDVPQTDIVSPWAGLIPRPAHHKWSPPNPKELTHKTGMVAWVVSTCSSKSQRNEYVTELRKYISVDILGRCGDTCLEDEAQCFQQVAVKYKFYLSFETSYCQDYITEKAWRPLSAYIVPVVLGAGNYSNTLPKHSYIDVRDFTGPKHLAQYLTELDGNDEQYLSYFNWKATHLAVSRIPPGLCRLCEILHTPDYPYKSQFDFASYWNSENQCHTDQAERDILHLT